MMSIASMPMYDFHETRSAAQDLWGSVVQRLNQMGVYEVPPLLTFGNSVREFWDDSALIFSQCCGYDVVHRYRNKLCPIATPHYTAPFCNGPNYASIVIVRDDSLLTDITQAKGAIAAINGVESHSGMSALRDIVSRDHNVGSFFEKVIVSGSHIDSVALVKNGKAEIAAIDSVTFSLMSRHAPKRVKGIRIIGSTYCAMAPPYVLSARADAALVRKIQIALTETFNDSATKKSRDALLIGGISIVSQADYDQIKDVEDEASSRGYPDLI